MTDNKQPYFSPAAPGYWTLDLIGSDDPDSVFEFWRNPVVAWEMRLADEDKPERAQREAAEEQERQAWLDEQRRAAPVRRS